ncbi:DUF3343 domain-containing protein [Alloiococcus sp. CFN-8]|uniref:DUF3343 domain-containing protein n=1 Tax=Alloiococcus sp. CFN-8 TaxID=3416081 RepID=UPI003CF6B18B
MFIFNSTNQGMLLYNEMKKEGLNPLMTSTPCGLRRGCNQSIIISLEQVEKVIELVEKKEIKVVNIYKIVKKNNQNTYVPIKKIISSTKN